MSKRMIVVTETMSLSLHYEELELPTASSLPILRCTDHQRRANSVNLSDRGPVRGMVYRCPGCGQEFGAATGEFHEPNALSIVTCPTCEGMWPESKMNPSFRREVDRRIYEKVSMNPWSSNMFVREVVSSEG